MKDLLVAVPSRGRPQSIARLWDAMQATCRGNTTLMVGLDDDDVTAQAYPQGPVYRVRSGLRFAVAWLNELTAAETGQYRFIGALGDDFVPRTAGWDVRVMEALAQTPFTYGNEMFPGRAPGESCCHIFCRAGVVKALGYFAPPTLRHMYCVAPDTPVLTADLRWIPAGKVAVGDDLVGVDEWPLRPRASRHYRRATVIAAERRIAECVQVELEDGRQVTCSVEHKWLTVRRWKGKGQRGPGTFDWRESAQLREGDQIVSPLRVWDEETSFEAGWLSGIFDGEGTACRCGGTERTPYANTILSVAQNPGPVLNRIEAGLGAMDIPYRRGPKRYYAGRDGVVVLNVTPRSRCIELLGRLQTTRLRPEVLWEDMAMQPRDSTTTLAKVRRVCPVGAAEVASLETSTGTFLANGLVAHNCDNIWVQWGRAAGITYLDDVIIEHLHPAAGKAQMDATYEASAALMGPDEAAWRAYCGDPDGLAADAAKLKALT